MYPRGTGGEALRFTPTVLCASKRAGSSRTGMPGCRTETTKRRVKMHIGNLRLRTFGRACGTPPEFSLRGSETFSETIRSVRSPTRIPGFSNPTDIRVGERTTLSNEQKLDRVLQAARRGRKVGNQFVRLLGTIEVILIRLIALYLVTHHLLSR